MTTSFRKDSYGLSAYIDSGHGLQIAMSGGAPCVEWSFRVQQLQQWLTTLEEVMVKEGNAGNRRDLEGIYFSLKAAHGRHLDQHAEIVTDTPTADDLQTYLAAYAAAVGGAQ